MGREILDEAYRHFALEGRQYEYGRGDITLGNKSGNHRTDPSRTEQDLDHDGYYGVDCSSLVWRGLKNAGYDVGDTPFATSQLFDGREPTHYAKQHFDVVPGEEARKTPGSLQPGDILMFNSSHGRHVGIFKGYDDKGNIEFYGSQVSTGPALTKAMGPTDTHLGYWNQGDFQIVGALRAKPEFQKHEPAHGHAKVDIPEAPDGPMVRRPHRQHADQHAAAQTAPASSGHRPAQPTHAPPPQAQGHEEHLRKGARGGDVTGLQNELAALGYPSREAPLHPDGRFGPKTDEALRAFQRDHGLKPDGVVGPETNKTLQQQLQQAQARPQEKAPLRLDDPAHPDHGMFKQALDAVHRLDAQHQRPSGPESGQLAGSLTAKARQEGLQRIDHAVLSEDASRTYAVQGDLRSPFKRVAEVDTLQGIRTPLEQSSANLQQAQATPSQAQPQTQQQEASRTQQHAPPGMSH